MLETNMFFYNIGRNNFGDYINKIFFEKLLDRNDLIFNTASISKKHYLTTGSILEVANKNSIVVGSGFINDTCNIGSKKITGKGNNKILQKPFKIYIVRGPLTRNKLLRMGIECPEKYGDPLILFPLIYNNKYINIKYKVGIIPHYIDKKENNLRKLISSFDSSEVKIIDIIIKNNNYERFIDNILSCEYVISSSLHGVIMGLIYRKKTIYVQFSNKVVGNGFKFNDFFASLDIKYTVKNKYDISLLNNIINIDYKKLKELIFSFINEAPFIEKKEELKNKYIAYENEIINYQN